MLFLHLAKANSIREVTNGLKSITGNLNYLGITNKVPSKSLLSYINEHRDWRLFREFYFLLKNDLQARGFLKRKMFNDIDKKIYLLDSTVITLCLKVFDWAKYRQQKGAVKLHTLLDYDGLMPSYLFMTKGSQADVKHAQYMTMPKGSVIVADRAYEDFKMLYSWDKDDIDFVLLLKNTIKYKSVTERELSDDTEQEILIDEEIELTEKSTWANYPKRLRRIVLCDKKNNRTLVFVINNFSWTALITLLLLKHLKEIADYPWALSNLIAFLRMNLFVKISLIKWINEPFLLPDFYIDNSKQLSLFD